MLRQINNLKIKHGKNGKYQVVTPDKRILDEFVFYENAEKFAKGIVDFVKVGGKVQQ
jgi:hypothetical protein